MDIIKYVDVKCMTLYELNEFKKKMLFEYCDKEKKVPLSVFMYNGVNIGTYYIGIKKKIMSEKDKRYADYSKNKFIKEDIDKMFVKRETKHKPENFEKMANDLFEYCNKKGFPTNSGNQRLNKWICAQRKRLRNDEVGKYKYNYLSSILSSSILSSSIVSSSLSSK
jgi:hypothetical protein